MADQPISNLNGGVQTVTVAATDLLATVDVSDTTQATTGTTKPIAMSKLTTFFNSALSYLSSVNLGYTAAPTTGTVTNDGGTDSTIPLFDATNAGLAQGSGGGTTNFLRADGTWAAAGAAPVDVCGISDTSGVYTYYSTLQAAVTAAPVNGTVEVFADITETGAVLVTITSDKTINFNGHTYTLDNVGTTNAIECSGTGANLKNGIIKRINGGNVETNSLALKTAGVVNLDSMMVLNPNGTPIYNNGGTVTGGYYEGFGTAFRQTTGSIKFANIYSTNGKGFRGSSLSGIIEKCTIKADSSYGIEDRATVIDCTVTVSAGTYAIDVSGGSNGVFGTYSNNLAGGGIRAAIVENCTSEATNYGIFGTAYNSKGVSSTNFGINGAAFDSVAISAGSEACSLSDNLRAENCSFESTDATAAAVRLWNFGQKVNNCTLTQVAATFAFSDGNTSGACEVSNCVTNNATSLLGGSMTQGSATHDTEGNIQN